MLDTTNNKTIVTQVVTTNATLTASITTLTANNKSLTDKLKTAVEAYKVLESSIKFSRRNNTKSNIVNADDRMDTGGYFWSHGY